MELIKKLLILSLLVFSTSSFAGYLMIDLNANYHSDEDNVQTYKYGTTIGQAFLGAAINKSGTLYFGQNIVSFSRNYTTGGLTYTYSTLELGPKLTIYFDVQKTWLITAMWNPYAQGTRKNATVQEDIKGSSMEFGFGYQVKLSKSTAMGVIMTYHALSVSKVISASNVETTVSQSYTSIYPMLSLSLRF